MHIKLNGKFLNKIINTTCKPNKILQKYIDSNIELVANNNEIIEGTFLSSNGGQIVLRKPDSGLLMLPNTGNYRFSVGSLPEGLITRPTLLWTVNTPKAGKQNVEISYQTAGMNWHAEYVALLNDDDSKIDLNCWVSIENNSGATYKNANLKLVAGDVNLVNNIPRPMKCKVCKRVIHQPINSKKEDFSNIIFMIFNDQRHYHKMKRNKFPYLKHPE